MVDVEVLTPEGEVFERRGAARSRPGPRSAKSASSPTTRRCWRRCSRPSCACTSPTRRPCATPRRTAGCRSSATAPGCWSRRRSRPRTSTPATLKDQLADAEQRLSESEKGSADFARAQKDRDRAEAFLAIARDERGSRYPSAGIQSRALRARLRNMLPAYGGQEQIAYRAPSATFPQRGIGSPCSKPQSLDAWRPFARDAQDSRGRDDERGARCAGPAADRLRDRLSRRRSRRRPGSSRAGWRRAGSRPSATRCGGCR